MIDKTPHSEAGGTPRVAAGRAAAPPEFGRPDRLGFPALTLLALIASLGPVTIDLYLPALPQITRDFATTSSAAQWTLSAFILGFAFGQPFYGPMADRYGRRPVLLGALAAFAAVSLFCALAPDLEWLVGGRFLQGLVGGAPMVVVRANVRDRLPADRAAPALAMISSLMAVGPMAAPFLGGLLTAHLSWRAIFLGLAFWASVVFAAGLTHLKESLDPAFRQAFSPKGVLASYRILLRSGFYRAHIFTGGLSFCGLFVFVSASPILLQDVIGVNPVTYGLLFGASAFCYVLGATTGGRLSGRVRPLILMGVGVFCEIAGGFALLLFAFTGGTPEAWMVSAPQGLYAFGAGFVFPQAVGGALSRFPERAGAASSLQSFTSFVMASSAGLVALALLDRAVMAGGAGLAAAGASAAACGGLAALALTGVWREVRAEDVV